MATRPVKHLQDNHRIICGVNYHAPPEPGNIFTTLKDVTCLNCLKYVNLHLKEYKTQKAWLESIDPSLTKEIK